MTPLISKNVSLFSITGFLDSVHRPESHILDKTTFRKLDLLPEPLLSII
jgi:hypothetical protein